MNEQNSISSMAFITALTIWIVFCLTSRTSSVKFSLFVQQTGGRSGGAMVLGKLPVPGRPTIWITVGQGPTALVVGAGVGFLEIFTLIYPFLFSFSLSLGDGPI